MSLSRHIYCLLLLACIVLFAVSCNTTRYVPKGGYLLKKNVVELNTSKTTGKREKLNKNTVARYIQQRPNRRLLGINFYLGAYSASDTSKHDWWHRLWNEKIGDAPVILDSTLIERSKEEMQIYVRSKGYLTATLDDSVSAQKRKATVHYIVNQNQPYTISQLDYRITDNFLRQLIMEDTANSLVKVGAVFDRIVFDAERERITERLRNMGFFSFNTNSISYTADSTKGDNKVSIVMNVRRRVERYEADGTPVYGNHPLYRIGRIVVNSDYDPTKSIQQNNEIRYDTVNYNGIEILYVNKLYIRPEILAGAIRLSPNELYDNEAVQRTYYSVSGLGYSASINFTPLVQPDSIPPIEVTIADSDSSMVSTREESLLCNIQCSPLIRQNFNTDLELSTTADYYSIALTLGYQNRNLLKGAEIFNVAFRGAYEFVKIKNKSNSYEFGITTALDIPRLLLPVNKDKLARFRQASTKVGLSYNIQRRPDYHRTLVGANFGYSWTLSGGARFTINPVDINVVSVPWVDQDFLDKIDNPYLRNSYNSQLIAGLSAGYYYTTNPDPKSNSFTIKANADANGNLLRGLTSWFTDPVTRNGETYYNLFGLRFAQYARSNIEISNRINLNEHNQIAWRFYAGGGVPYGNSNSVPFERLFFAGGSNSMRGWQVRSLGPGSVPADTTSSYPNQLGNLRLEANLEYRVNVTGGLNLGLFFDAGNIWMNSKGEKREAARFRLNTFYKQLAFNTGLGMRYDFDYFIIRLDWGWKLYNPTLEKDRRWLSEFRMKNTALHFAIGFPF